MRNVGNPRGARYRARWAAAWAVGAVVILASSPAWSQDRGGVVPSEKPRPVVLSSASIQEAGGLYLRPHRRPTPAIIQQKIDGPTFGVFTPPFGTSDGSRVSLRFVVLQQNGRGELELVAWTGSGSLGTSILRRVVMAALP